MGEAMNRVVLGDIGWSVARMVVNESGEAESLHLISPADTSENRYAPCESVAIYGRVNIARLRNFLNDHLHADEKGEPS